MSSPSAAPGLLEPVRDRERIRVALADGQRLVACLCAGWCSSCTAWHRAFSQLAQEFAGDCFVWIDIEDHAELVSEVEVETLPVLLVQAADEAPRFLGPIEPREAMVRSLLFNLGADEAAHDAAGIRTALSR